MNGLKLLLLVMMISAGHALFAQDVLGEKDDFRNSKTEVGDREKLFDAIVERYENVRTKEADLLKEKEGLMAKNGSEDAARLAEIEQALKKLQQEKALVDLELEKVNSL